jgi:TolA-binding protein
MKRAFLVVAGLTLLASIAGCGSGGSVEPLASGQSQPDRLLFDRGKQSLSDGKNKEAATIFQTLVNSYPDSLFADRAQEPLFALGRRLLADGNVVEALTTFQTLINFHPDSEFAGRANLALDDCARSQECNFYLVQVKALPPGGGQIFYPSMPDDPLNPKMR